MISRRTTVLFFLAIVLSGAMGIVLHNRQALCAEAPHGFARRAPIRGASGTDTFVCRAMIEHMPPAEIALTAAWWFGVIAALRSVWVDREARRRWYATLE